MALNISGQIELNGGLIVESVYARVNPYIRTTGDYIDLAVPFWINEISYQESKLPMIVFEGLLNLSIPYNRENDGNDILLFSSEKLKEQLEGLGYSVVITGL